MLITYCAQDKQGLYHSVFLGVSLLLVPTVGAFGFTVPFALDVSGEPSDFVLFSVLESIGMLCLVSVLDMPSCLASMLPCDLGFGLPEAGASEVLSPSFWPTVEVEVAVSDQSLTPLLT